MTSFNGALEELRCERLKLEADLKTTDLRKLVLVQELRLLKEFEKNDITLASPDPNPYPYPHPNPNPHPDQVRDAIELLLGDGGGTTVAAVER